MIVRGGAQHEFKLRACAWGGRGGGDSGAGRTGWTSEAIAACNKISSSTRRPRKPGRVKKQHGNAGAVARRRDPRRGCGTVRTAGGSGTYGPWLPLQLPCVVRLFQAVDRNNSDATTSKLPYSPTAAAAASKNQGKCAGAEGVGKGGTYGWGRLGEVEPLGKESAKSHCLSRRSICPSDDIHIICQG